MTELMDPAQPKRRSVLQQRCLLLDAPWLGDGRNLFRIIADYVGRTKALAATILIYSLFTGCQPPLKLQQLAAFRFITDSAWREWAAGAACGQVWPDHLRARARDAPIGSRLGYFFAALITRVRTLRSWRYVYVVGPPRDLRAVIRLMIKEPERWFQVLIGAGSPEPQDSPGQPSLMLHAEATV